jgi:hypothetical protein
VVEKSISTKHVQLKQTIQTEDAHVRFDEAALRTLHDLERSSSHVLLRDGYCEDKLYPPSTNNRRVASCHRSSSCIRNTNTV